MNSTFYRRAARRLYGRDGEIEVEDAAIVEDADDKPGCWVECWLFVPDFEARAELKAAAKGKVIA